MKPLSLAALLAAVVLAVPAPAQDLPELGRTVWRQDGLGGPNPYLYPLLRQNVTLAIKGTILPGSPLDATWTGVGPEFTIRLAQVVDGRLTPSVCQGEIWATDEGYRVKCAVTVLMPAYNTYGNHTVETYLQVGPEVTALLKPGQSVPILTVGNQTTTLTLVQGTTDYAAQQQITPASASTMVPAMLPQNMRLDFTGQGFDDNPVDIGLTTVSSSFNVSLVTGEREIDGLKKPIITHCEGTLNPTPDGYLLKYQIGCTLPLALTPTTSEIGLNHTFVFFLVNESSAVALSPGVPVTVFNVNGKSLTVRVAPVAKK